MSNQSTSAETPESMPNSLPLAVVTVGEMGAVTATCDGIEFPPIKPAQSWSRSQFGELLDALTLGRKRTIRIEVRESDGTVFTDIVNAQAAKTGEKLEVSTPPARSESRRARRSNPPRLIEFSGSGFIPGEDITVAIPVSTAEGNSSGTARATIDLNQLMDRVTEVLLIGRISGNIVTERLP